MNWISVKNELPQGGKCLIFIKGEYHDSIHVAYYNNETDKWKGAQAHSIFENVTHWMPLPKPPEVTE